jgi:prepilin signal peptidase PulO-like enzyme (type II secretory pathway)
MTSNSLSELPVLVALAGIFGLLVGSFLNVAIYRIPLGLSVSKPRSFCPTCQRQLTWWENIPLASWIALRRRCRTCHQPISLRYPLVELATGLAFCLVTWSWHGSVVSIGYCVLAASMITVSMIEFDGHRSPLSVAAIGTAIAQVVIVAGASWHHQWHIVGGSLVGSVTTLAAIGLLRLGDPECTDPRNYGRSCLLLAGCWLGGLSLVPLAVAAGVWIVTYSACMVGAWFTSRPASGIDANTSREPQAIQAVLRVPLVSALALAMTAALIVAG